MEGKDGRTERATPKRRGEERKKGNLCVSQEITTVFVLVLGLLGIRFAVPMIYARLSQLIMEIGRLPLGGQWDASTFQSWFVNGIMFVGMLLAPVVVPVMIGSVIANMGQVGPYYSVKTLKWKFNALNPIKGVKKLFSVQSILKLFISLLKMGLIIFVIYLVIRSQLPMFIGLQQIPPDQSVSWLLKLLFKIVMIITILFISIAILDWCMKKYRHEKGMMMTKQEVKDERKQQEISPEVKKNQMKKMREFSLMRMMAEVPKADVIVTNPTHVSIALRYDNDSMGAPKVVAKGLRLVALRIREIAKEHNIPIIERPALARGIYKHVKVGHEIPGQFYNAVAELMAYLYRMGDRRIIEKMQNASKALK